MNAPAILLARSNSDAGVKLVLRFGCDNDPHKEREAGRSGNAAPFDYCHVVLGTNGAPPRLFGERLRSHRDGTTTWLSGTYGDFMRVLLDDRMDATIGSGFCGALQRAIEGLEPFGNPKCLAVRKGVEVPTGPAELKAAGDAEGGIFVVAADQRTEQELVKAGARVLDRAQPGETKLWTEAAGTKSDDGNVDVVSVGTLVLPLAASDVRESDLKLLRPLADAYARLQQRATNRDLAALLRYEFETTSLLVAADRGVFRAISASGYAPAQYLASSAIDALDARDTGAQEKRQGRTATKAAA
ncbi:MAG: hypothetical protein ACR2M1_04285 [Gemmatimonadaceae bacterium]